MAGQEWEEQQNAFSAEQWREVKEAEALQNDSFFAYRLQMKEAIAASIASAPSSSCSYASEPSDLYSSMDEDNRAISEVFRLQMEEIGIFDRIRNDQEYARAEMRKEYDKLNQRALEHRDVNYLRDMVGYGGMNRYYGSLLSESKCFRLYFKGMSREESVNNSVIRFFGAGIAICDPDNDNPIFEMRKPLNGGDIVQESVDFVALIECLNAALMFDLKRVAVFCDDNLTFLCLMGKMQNVHQNIKSLMQEVLRLNKKFTKCMVSLAPTSSIKNVYKLASDAIALQLRMTPEACKVKNPVCTICLEEVESKMMFTVDVCHHEYCIPCFKLHVASQLYQARVPSCPHQGCDTLLSVDSCKPLLTPQLADLMAFRIREISIPASDKIYCPYPLCSALMLASDVIQNSKKFLSGGDDTSGVIECMKVGASKCTTCGNYFCIFCKSVWHKGMSCSEYKNSHMYLSTEDSKLKSLATRNLWRQCVKCKHMIERNQGCNHITCRCGHQFCYMCGGQWKSCCCR